MLIERLVALVPRPRKHLVTYHGVLAPAAGLRPRVVPRVEEEAEDGGGEGEGGRGPVDVENEATCRLLPKRTPRLVPHAPGKRRWGGRRAVRRRHAWAELLLRVHEVDVLVCPNCGARRKVLAAIHDPDSIRRLPGALGLSSAVPELAPARGPPGNGEWWGA